MREYPGAIFIAYVRHQDLGIQTRSIGQPGNMLPDLSYRLRKGFAADRGIVLKIHGGEILLFFQSCFSQFFRLELSGQFVKDVIQITI